MKKYIKDGKECIFCSTRKKLIQITQEEIVRQEFVSSLIEKYDVPAELISVEVPLSYYKKGKPGRADIIVSGLNIDSNELIPLIVIECKSPSISLTDKVFHQVMKYDEFLGPEIMVMTNGRETISYSWNIEKNDYCEIENIPSYEDIISGIEYNFKKEITNNWTRPNHKFDLEKTSKILAEDGIIGEDTDEKLISLITNLSGLIYDDSNLTNELIIPNKTSILDGGLRYTTFGNAGGGSFTGFYRYFLIENKKKETEIVSLSIMGKLSARSHPKWGNSTGYTLLNIAIDDFENSHLSLEYAIDRFVQKENENYTFWHDGTLTVGRLGRVKNRDVIDFVQEKKPELIVDGKILLGRLDNSKVFEWSSEDVINLITNFIEYGFIRDQFRETYKQASI